MKKTSKLIALTLVMMLSITMVFTSCSSSPKTLEELANKDTEFQQELDESIAAQENDQLGIDVEIKENTVIYTFKYKMTLEGDQLEVVKTTLEKGMETMGSSFETVAKNLEAETEISGITVRVIYQNGDGEELYSGDFTSGE